MIENNMDLDDGYRPADRLNDSSLLQSASLWSKYDHIFLITFSVQAFNGGLKLMFVLAF